MDDQSVLNLKGDFNTEGTEDAEKTGKRKNVRRKIIAESGRDTPTGSGQASYAEKMSGFLAKSSSRSNESGRGEPLPYS
jgi:hypothetical protein